jgi:hypothetical protein
MRRPAGRSNRLVGAEGVGLLHPARHLNQTKQGRPQLERHCQSLATQPLRHRIGDVSSEDRTLLTPKTAADRRVTPGRSLRLLGLMQPLEAVELVRLRAPRLLRRCSVTPRSPESFFPRVTIGGPGSGSKLPARSLEVPGTDLPRINAGRGAERRGR